jgi:hypothetical protein
MKQTLPFFFFIFKSRKGAEKASLGNDVPNHRVCNFSFLLKCLEASANPQNLDKDAN